MKKRLLKTLAGALIISAFILPSCELIETCGTCEYITEDADGNIISTGTPIPLCGDAYTEKVNSSPTTIGGITTYWNCY